LFGVGEKLESITWTEGDRGMDTTIETLGEGKKERRGETEWVSFATILAPNADETCII